MFVLDTCIISEMARPKGVQAVKDWNDADRSRLLAIPTAVVVEIQRGIELLKPRERQKSEDLARWLDFVLSSEIKVLPMNTEVARLYGTMTAVPSLKNFWVPNPSAKKPKLGHDLLIAATAIVHHATLVSLDLHDFARIHRHFPLPGFVCPGMAGDLDAFSPLPSRRRMRRSLRGWESIPTRPAPASSSWGSNPLNLDRFARQERSRLRSWIDATAH